MATYKIIKIERKELKDGRKIIKATLRDTVESIETENVTIWPDYPNFEALDEGYTTEGDLVVKVNGDFKNTSLYPARTKTLGGNGKGAAAINKAMDKKAENIGKSQDRKEESIKTSSTMRDAVLIALSELGHNADHEQYANRVLYWRDWLWKHWDDDLSSPPL